MTPPIPRLACTILGLLAAASTSRAAELRYLAGSDGETIACIVPAEASLLQTSQLFPPNQEAAQDSDQQATALLRELDHALAAAQCDPAAVIRVNLYATTPESANAGLRAVRAHYPAGRRPAVTCVIGKLPHATAAISLDATAIASPDAPPNTPGLLPAGRAKLYISGQAEKSPDPQEAARKTLASLKNTLTFLESAPENVVHAKCFLTPMSAADAVTMEVKVALGQHVPVTFVEWKSPETVPVEIELVAYAPAPKDAPALEFLTPPGMTPSPLFARATRITGRATVHTASLQGPDGATAPAQVTAIYEALKVLLDKSGTNLAHLAKATYYPTTDDTSRALNTLRPNYYDPKRPPAASKAMVPAIYPANGISVDLIAVVP